MTGELQVERRGAVTRLILNRPERLNALNAGLVDSLHLAVSDAAADGTRLLVLEGTGRGFSAGFDFSDLDQQSEGDLALRFLRLELLLQAAQHAPVATLALVHGACFGAAADLVAACMHRVAAPDARFRMPGLQFGVVLGTRRLANLIGSDAARGLLATSRLFGAEEAQRLGFVREVQDRAAWPQMVEAYGREACALSPNSQQAMLRLTIPDTRDLDLAELARSLAVPGLRSRMAAYYAQLRKPAPGS